ncbi:hypothetical protein KP509_1Z221300 [Ceratopteris richardii]|nr:hypothetical protein KP509_1Z221300 [Ceratopteris richardii]
MNAFRLAGDMSHLFSILLLLLKIHTIKSCAGLALYFTVRYSKDEPDAQPDIVFFKSLANFPSPT